MQENHPAYDSPVAAAANADRLPTGQAVAEHRDSIAEAEGVQYAGRQERQLQLAKALKRCT